MFKRPPAHRQRRLYPWIAAGAAPIAAFIAGSVLAQSDTTEPAEPEPIIANSPYAAVPEDNREWHDLLKLVDPEADAVSGEWSMNAEGLLELSPEKCARIVIPETDCGDYDLHAEFVRENGANDVNLFFPVGDSEVALLLSGWEGAVSGLDSVGGRRPDANETGVRPGKLINGRKYAVDLRVRLTQEEATISVALNQGGLIQWTGPTSKLSVFVDWQLPKRSTFGLGDDRGTVKFTSLEIRTASGELKPTDPG